MTPTERTFDLRTGLEVADRVWGDSPTRLLAIHGWIDNAGSFDALAPQLADALDVEIHCIDLPGHGQSDWKPAAAEYHYVDWVATLADVLAALEWETVSLLGHSMGAGICGLFAGTFPERVERLIMLEGIGPYTTDATAAVANLRRAIEGRDVHLARMPRVMDSLDAAVERKRSALPYLDEISARALVSRGTRPAEDGVAYSHDPRLTARSLLRFTEEHVLAMFSEVRCPTLVIRAEQGLQYPEDGGNIESRMAALADAEVVRVDGHHHVHLTDADRVVPALLSFLSGASKPRVES